ncbi:MAG: hypothetical protein RSE32_07985 [Comamonas sp.]|uniref:hypothetical protein n=1 Tax=Comamonas sp. TaxID=34028 RepID=UPI002FCB913C
MSTLQHLTPKQLAKYSAEVAALQHDLLRLILDSGVKDSGVAMDALLQALLEVGQSSNRLPELRMAFASHASATPASSAGTWLHKH